MKKIVSLLLVITFVFALGGCFGEETEKVTPEDVKNRVISEAKEYLKETYPDDEFTYISGRSPNWAYPYYELAFTTKEYDNQEFTVFAEPDEELKTNEDLTVYHYCDNYFQYSMEKEAENYFSDMAEEYIGCDIETDIVFETSIGFAQLVNSDLTFEENLKNGQKGILPWFKSDCNLDKKEDEIYNLLEQFVREDIETLIRFEYKTTPNDSEYSGFYQFTTYDGIIEEAN